MFSNLNKTTFCLGFALIFFLSCADNSNMEFPSKEVVKQRYSSSAESSSSDAAVSSSSFAVSSSSSDDVSSSSTDSSSSIQSSSSEPSSSGAEQSSSSVIDNCKNFVEEKIEHYGMEKSQFCDSRDGKKYVYVTIGQQVWMAENLNYAAENSKCYGENGQVCTSSNDCSTLSDNEIQDNCEKYGRLYNWLTAMANSASSTSNVKGVCPNGWHIPSKDEWEALIKKVGNSQAAGIGLKAKSDLWPDNSYTNDEYGFSALPGGLGNWDKYYYVGSYGFWWSTREREENAQHAYSWAIDTDDMTSSYSSKEGIFSSVRCLKNQEE